MDRLTAIIRGGLQYPQIRGVVKFERLSNGFLVTASIHNLPPFSRESNRTISPFAFHIHQGNSCSVGTVEEPFPETSTHLNLDDQPHGNHSGDFPVLMPDKHGWAFLSFYTDRFLAKDIIGKVLIIHESPDDYRTQPSGNSGHKIACGIINQAPNEF